MTLKERVDEIAAELLSVAAEDKDQFTTLPQDPLDRQQVESALVKELVVRHPGIENLSAIDQENLLLADVIRDLGFNPNLARQSTTALIGDGGAFSEAENEALKNQLAGVLSPLRSTDPRATAEVLRDAPPDTVSSLLRENVFPDSPVLGDPTGLDVIGDLLTPIVGLSERQIQDLPTASRPIVRAIQSTLLSPGGLLTGFFVPGALATSRFAGPTGVFGNLNRLFGASPGRALGAEFAGEVFGNVAEEAGAPVPLQIGIEALAGLVSGNVFDEIAEAGAKRTARTLVKGDFAKGEFAVPRTQDEIEALLAGFTQDQLDDLAGEIAVTILTTTESQTDPSREIADGRFDTARAEAVRESNAIASEEEAMLRPFTRAALELANAKARQDREMRQAEREARAKRESAAIMAEEEERLQDVRRESLRNAQNSRQAVDLIDAVHEGDLRLEALRQSEAIAVEEERMLKEFRRRALAQANAEREASRTSVAAQAESGPSNTGSGSSFGFGTGAGDRLAEARRRREEEQRRSSLPPSARRIGQTDIAAGGF